MLLLLTLLPPLFLRACQACMETAWRHGRLDTSQRLSTVNISDPQAGSCVCCAFCHQQTGCASLSYNSATSECELYSTVASYATLQPDLTSEWTYYVMPGRSATDQFCRQDSDCVTAGDFCRGRFCTSLDKVTCRTLGDLFGGIRHYDVMPIIYGWVQGTQLKMICWMTQGGEGYTTVLWSARGLQLDSTTVMKYNTRLETGVQGQSLLYLAEHFRRSETDPTYRISIWTHNSVSWTQNSGWSLLMAYNVPRDEPVFTQAARTHAWLNLRVEGLVSWNASMLWMPSSGSTLLTTNADDGQTSTGAMATTDGVTVNGETWIFMLE